MTIIIVHLLQYQDHTATAIPVIIAIAADPHGSRNAVIIRITEIVKAGVHHHGMAINIQDVMLMADNCRYGLVVTKRNIRKLGY